MSDIDSLPFPTFLISSNNDVNNNNNNNNSNNNINDHNNTSNSLSNPQNLTFANLNNILDLPKFMSLNNPCYVKELELGLEEEEEDDDDDHKHRHHGFADHDILSSMSDIETPNWLRDEPMWLKDHEILLNCKNTMVDRHGSNGLSTRFPAIDHSTVSEKCFSATLGCKDNTMEVNSEPHDFTSQTSSFQQEGCDFTSCQTSSFHFESCDFTSCQTCSCRYENCSNTHVFSINLCKKDVEPQGFTSQTTSNFHENYNTLGTATTAAIATTSNTDILCQDDHNNFTSQKTSNIHENCGVLSIKCKDDVESPHGFTSQTISIAQEYCGESDVYKDSKPTCEDGFMASKMAHVNLGSKLGKHKGIIADSIDCDGITELQQDVMSVNNSPVIKDQQWSNNVEDPNLDQSTRNLIAVDETVNDCSVTSVGDDHPIQPFVAIDDTFKECLAIELQDLTSFDTLNQNLSNVKTNDSSQINDSCAPTLGTQCIFSNCLSSNLATFPSPGDLYINYNQNVVDHGRLPPLVSLSTPRFSFHPQGTRDSHTTGIPLLCPSSSPQLRMTTLLTPLPSEATSSLAHNMFKQETIMNYKGNTIHQDDCISSSFVSNDLGNLHWRSPTAKTRAARKRRIAENRLPIQVVPSVQPARIKAMDRTLALHMVASQDKQTPTSEEKVHDHELLQKMGIETNLRFLLQKELKPSDVGTLGRIVLPKRDAEAHLPDLTAREGITLSMEDIIDSRVWYLRFRFWPNNKSRMYLLENTRDFVKTHNLQEGDFLMLYKDDQAEKYVIQAKKVARLENSTTVTGRKIQRANVSEGRKSVSLTKNRKDRHRTVARRNSTEKSSQKSPVKEDLIQGFHDDVSRLLPQQDNVDKIEIDDMNIEAIFELK